MQTSAVRVEDVQAEQEQRDALQEECAAAGGSPAERYQMAMDIYNNTFSNAKVETALAIFRELGDYEDSSSYVQRCEQYLSYAKGRQVEFGEWNGRPITWTVLAEDGKRRLLLADRVVDYQPFHTEKDATSWNACYLRRWLNGTFLDQAFTLRDRMKILLSWHRNNTDSRWCDQNGPDTRDKVFIFDLKEMDEYLPDQKDRAVDEWWWLRGHASETQALQAVYCDGSVYRDGIIKDSRRVGVRPAMWVRVSM